MSASSPSVTTWDTGDRRLAAWGAALEWNGTCWTVRLQIWGDTATRDVTLDGQVRLPPPAAVDLVSAFTRGARLRSIARSEPAVDAEPALVVPTIVGRPQVGEVVTAAVATSVQRFIAHEPFVRIGDDPEALHRSRVAIRRLHAYLRIFDGVLEEAWADDLRDELRWLIDVLGSTRDLDVILELVLEGVPLMPSRRGSAEAVVVALGEARARSAAAALAAMRSERYTTLVERLAEAAREPPLTTDASRRGRKHLAPFVRGPWNVLHRRYRSAGSSPSDRELHKLRIATKRVRYAADAVEPVFGEPAATFASAASDLQDALGDARDAVIAAQWVRGWAAASGGSSRKAGTRDLTAAIHQLGGHEERWRAAWTHLSDKRLRRWFRT